MEKIKQKANYIFLRYEKFSLKNKKILILLAAALIIVNGFVFFIKLKNASNAPISAKDIRLIYDGKIFVLKKEDAFSQTFLNLKILEIQDSVNKDASPNMPDFKGDITKTIPAMDGIKVNTDKLTSLIVDKLKNTNILPISIPVIKTFGNTHSEDELNKIRAQASSLIKDPLTVSTKGVNFTLSSSDLKYLLSVKEKPDPKNPKKMILSLRLDESLLNKKLGDYAKNVEDITHSEYNYHEARTNIYSQFFGGFRKPVEIPTGIAGNLSFKVLGSSTDTTPGESKKVYLTFDDGPNAIYHPMILDILKRYSVKATFFLIGKNSQSNPAVTLRTISEGHKIGNHSFTHPFLPQLTSSAIFNEISQTDKILQSMTGLTIKMFRPPYGGINLAVKQDSDALGLKLFMWDVDPRDWSEPAVDELVRRVVTNTKNGSDILLHSNHLVTVQALPKIIETLQSEGYTFDTLN